MGIIHQCAPFREFVDMWRLHFWMEAHAADPVVLIVDSYEQDVGFIGSSKVGHGSNEKG